ncbi:dihydrodipicolinate synthase family protein [Nocardiopsis sp. CA-288880]|uniref:dihydrodipicolinate synthase family protein n=1 Tax=Nocardiopsis sp. CA-288880 TaxID=3239995 RepID=UPI003D96AA62
MTALRGLVPILATPFHPDGTLDDEGLRRLVRFQLACGVDGLAVFGMASEGFALTADERSRILDAVAEEASGAVPVVAGVNGTSVETAVEQARAAEAGGADSLMVLPPYLVKPSARQVVEFYTRVCAATALDVMVQDAPGATGVSMAPAVIAEIAALERVTSVKVESPPTPASTAAVRAALDARGADAAVLGGQNAFFLLEEYGAGAVGTMPACEVSDLLGGVLSLWEGGDRRAARRAYDRLLPLLRFGMQGGVAWAVHKEVLVARGVIGSAAVRLPAAPLDPRTAAGLAAILHDLGLPDHDTVVAAARGANPSPRAAGAEDAGPGRGPDGSGAQAAGAPEAASAPVGGGGATAGGAGR